MIIAYKQRANSVYFCIGPSCSQYAYVEGISSTSAETWITAHIHAFQFCGGVPRVNVPVNLKMGVVKVLKYEPIIHTIYQEMAEHYHTLILPARVCHPKDYSEVFYITNNGCYCNTAMFFY